MFKKIFKITSISFATLSAYSLISCSIFRPKVGCLETTRGNKIQLVNHLNTTKSQSIILVYNKQSQNSLREEIVRIQDICRSVNISTMLLVDHTDVRHLQAFAKMLKSEQINEQQPTSINLQGKINIFYVNPDYNTFDPFQIPSSTQLKSNIEQIRRLVTINPSFEQLTNSMSKFNRTTITKTCKDQKCVNQFRGKIKKIVDMDLLRGRLNSYGFYVTTGKVEAARIMKLLGEANKEDIHVYYNDLIGESHLDYSQWLENQGKNIPIQNRFLMMIRPRVHIISKLNYYSDVLWYMAALRNLNVPTFCINDTVERYWREQMRNQKEIFDDNELLRQVRQKFGNKLHLMVLQTPIMSELIRHSRAPWRYSIFQLLKEVPYPKKNLSHILNPQKISGKQIPVQLYKQIEYFIDNPTQHTELLKLLHEKQLQINAKRLKQLLNDQQNNSEWVLRMCGSRNKCGKVSAYEKYGLGLGTKVYKLDGQVQNVGLDEGDYLIREGSLLKLDQ